MELDLILSEQILNEALRLANDKGWRSAGVREISRELDISPGNLSYHFARKEEILK
ncbi:MAG: helix-turn-helix transcriptional regulator, partial [Gammaproteobacteria bacterium]|nr:helix-turn-helix transcriptional regulator [Gammaproteobacteria bacterium]NIR92588.1 helix-turn-helix transcriptional regulator [Gammaproteobacteria bacterium]NIW39477.1 TetR family transcriptional regulator [candidate division Zixibacteria bacterium]NIX54531.1 TetR family transcriptional regulator [candidate division Zixibacteria bacterium]